MSETVHGTAVLVGAEGILIRGASGTGKSALALALIERGARLVADDRLTLSACNGRIVATAPRATRGMLELRGRGLIEVACETSCVLRLVADIVDGEGLERMPEEHHLTTTLLGIALPRQPVPAAADWAIRLIEAALGGSSGPRSGDLRSA